MTLFSVLQTVLSQSGAEKSDGPEAGRTEAWIHDPLLSSRLAGPFQAQALSPFFPSPAGESEDELQRLVQDFLEIPDSEENRKFVFDLTRKPHVAGRENETATYVLQAFKDMGFRPWVVSFSSILR